MIDSSGSTKVDAPVPFSHKHGRSHSIEGPSVDHDMLVLRKEMRSLVS